MKNFSAKIAAFCIFILSLAGFAASPAQAIGLNVNPDMPSSSFVNGYSTINVTAAQEAQLRANILSKAASQAGVKYIFNTSEPGVSFDCSGFVSWVYYTQNIQMYRNVAGMRPTVRTVSASQVKPGDLIFSGLTANGVPTHVGIVADPKAKTFWHAAGPGDVVRLSSYAGSWYNTATFGTVIVSTTPVVTATTTAATTTASKPITATPVVKPSTQPAAQVTTVKRYVKSGINLNVRASASASSKQVGLLKGGTAVTGVISNGWMKITSGTYSGRYVSAAYLR